MALIQPSLYSVVIMKSFISSVADIMLLAVLLFSVATGHESLMSTAVSIYWVLQLLAVFACVVAMAIVGLIAIETNPANKTKLVNSLKTLAKRPVIIRRIWNVVCRLIIVGCLAYGGWVFTAVSYAIVSLISQLCLVIVRDTYKKNTPAEFE